MTATAGPRIAVVPAGQDLLNVQRKAGGGNTIEFKVTPDESHDLFIAEVTCNERGGPARHLHLEQDEFFYILEGEFIFAIGGQRLTPSPGDSLLGPRRVSHTWARIGDQRGRLLFVFSPAGQMVAFFDEINKLGSRPGQDPDIWRRHGMQVTGPPLPVE